MDAFEQIQLLGAGEEAQAGGSAGIADSDMLVALTNSDEVNMMACQIAHTLYRTPTKIARIRAPE